MTRLLSEIYSELLREEGYRPRIDEDGDVIFKREGVTYYISIQEDDREYFRLVYPNFYRIKDDDNRLQILEICNQLSVENKVVKVTERRGWVSAAVEVLCATPESISELLPRMIRLLVLNGHEFEEKIGRPPRRNGGGIFDEITGGQSPGDAFDSVIGIMSRMEQNAPLVITPDGSLFAFTTGEHQILLCNSSDASVRYRLRGHTRQIRSLALSPNGRLLVSSGDDTSVRLWDITDGTLCHELRGHTDWIRAVAIAPDNRTVASGADDKTIRLWDADRGRLLHVLRGPGDWPRTLVFSPDGTLVVAAGDDHIVWVWHRATGELLQQLEGHQQKVMTAAFSPDGRYLASAGADHTLRVWRVTDWSLHGTMDLHSDWIREIRFSPDGRLLASACDDRTVILTDVDRMQHIHQLSGHQRWVRSVAFSADGNMLLSSSDDGSIHRWDVASGRKIGADLRQEGMISAIRIVGRRAVSRSDRMACTWLLDADTEPMVVRAPLLSTTDDAH